MADVRTRIAPSPTGFFHIGTARTALFNYLYARKVSGKFILRIEDTDLARSKEEFTLDIIQGLNWLGLTWDEGPLTDESFGPYLQSKRLKIYQQYIDQLITSKQAYYCYCTAEELAKERKAMEARHLAPKYSGKCRELKTPPKGREGALRFKVEPQKVTFNDLIRGEVTFDMNLTGDFIIVKSDGWPTFLLAGTIDDFTMNISHVIRGEEHLANTPKQILIQKALNFLEPYYAHLPLIFNEDHTKMSKRRDPVSVTHDFREKGYLSEAMVNFMALLGWSPGDNQEIFTLDDLITEFTIEKVQKSPAIFDSKKLNWINGYYLRKLTTGDLAKKTLPFLQKAGIDKVKPDYLFQILGTVQERAKTLAEIPSLTDFYFSETLEYLSQLLIPKGGKKEKTKTILTKILQELEEIDNFTYDEIERTLRRLAGQNQISNNEILWPLRVALTGKEASPGTFTVTSVLGKEKSLKRIKAAIKKLS